MTVTVVTSPPVDNIAPMLGPAYLTAWLKKNGCSTIQIDANILYKKGITIEQIVQKIFSTDPDIVCLYTNYINFVTTMTLCRIIKERKREIVTIVGGPNVAYLREKILKDFPAVDICVHGEGEKPIAQVINAIEKKGDLSEVKGVIFRKEGKIINTGPAEVIQDLNTLPFPDFDDVPLRDYPIGLLPIMMNRGCLRNCSFCGVGPNRVHGYYRERSADNVFQEMKRNIEKYNINKFIFFDCSVDLKIEKFMKLCDLIIENKMKASWVIHYSKNIPESQLKKLVQAGLTGMIISPESASKRISKLNKKQINIEDIEYGLLPLLPRYGIKTHFWFIVGYPGETIEDVEETYNFVKRNEKYIDVAYFTPLGLELRTDLYKHPEKYGIIKNSLKLYYPYSIYCSWKGKDKYISDLHSTYIAIKLWQKFNKWHSFPFEWETRTFMQYYVGSELLRKTVFFLLSCIPVLKMKNIYWVSPRLALWGKRFTHSDTFRVFFHDLPSGKPGAADSSNAASHELR